MNLSFSLPYPLSLFVWRISISSLPSSFFNLSNSLTGRSLSHFPFLEARQWSTGGVMWQLCELPLCHLWRVVICPRRHAQRSRKRHMLLILITASQSIWFSLFFFFRLKSDGSTERNSRGVYQTDGKLKTCYCWKKVRPVDCVWWSCLLIVRSVNRDDNIGW